MVDRIAEIPVSGSTLPAGAKASPRSAAFLAGPENRLVTAAANRLLPDATGEVVGSHAMVVLWGGTGTGKTHLARGICRWWQEQFDQSSAEYVTAADFRYDLADAIKHKTVASLRQRLRSLKLLVLDDLERLPRDNYIHEELIHTLDALAESGAVLVATSSGPPATLSNLAAAVASRLSAGLVVSISAPGPAVRGELARRMSRWLGRPLSPAAAVVVAERTSGGVNELFGMVNELTSGVDGPSSLTAESIAQWMDDRAAERRPRMADIIRVVARYYSIPQKVLKSSSRRRSVVLARAMVIYLARQLSGLSYQRIGTALCGRDHTTIMHSYRKTESLAAHDLATQQAIADLERLLSVP